MAMPDEAKPTGTLGIERWVQFAFIGAALLSFWFLDHLFADVAAFVAQKADLSTPNPTIVTAASALISIILAAMMYRNDRIHGFSREVAVELSHVTWPTRQETWSNTLVVIVVSAIAAVILGTFDAAWSAVTDLIY
jgi:preprotein translocase subunit SecE